MLLKFLDSYHKSSTSVGEQLLTDLVAIAKKGKEKFD